jgi:hypothetical protein
VGQILVGPLNFGLGLLQDLAFSGEGGYSDSGMFGEIWNLFTLFFKSHMKCIKCHKGNNPKVRLAFFPLKGCLHKT